MRGKLNKVLRLVSAGKYGRTHIPGYSYCLKMTRFKMGLEIGGPSKFFSRKGHMPLYPFLGGLDNCNFSNKTVWQENDENEEKYRFDVKKQFGRQIISDAANLEMINDGYYDFVLSSHVIEHIANPILAVREWWRVTSKNGHLLMVIPDKADTFDHLRPVTQMDHLIHDYERNIGENDREHFSEILKLHDFERDSGTESFETFQDRLMSNIDNRCAHHHVFDLPLAVTLIEFCRFKVILAERVSPCHIVVAGKK